MIPNKVENIWTSSKVLGKGQNVSRMVLAWCGLPGWPEISSLPLCTWIILHCAAADNLDNWDNLWIIRSCARRTAPACRAPRCLKHSQAASVCASASHVCFMIYHLSRALKFWTRFFFGSCQKSFDLIFFKNKFLQEIFFSFLLIQGTIFFWGWPPKQIWMDSEF